MTDNQYMTNAEGHLVPIDMVKPEDKLRNDVVLELFKKASSLNEQLKSFKSKSFDDIDTFLEVLSERYGKTKGGKKGNITLTSYDGLKKVEVKNQEFLQFGPELQVAKDLIDECIRDWNQTGRAEIQAIVNHAFHIDKGRINKQGILGLRKIHFSEPDPRWENAMQAITDSINVEHSKRYVRIYERDDINSEWVAVSMNLAAL